MKTFLLGSRVRVSIKRPRRYAAGAAECLQGLLGVVEQFKPESINGEPAPGPAYLVRFDVPAKTWWTYQTPAEAWWFPPGELVGCRMIPWIRVIREGPGWRWFVLDQRTSAQLATGFVYGARRRGIARRYAQSWIDAQSGELVGVE